MNMAACKQTKKQGRKPIQLELVGGKPTRQRIWEQIRKHRLGFQIATVSEHSSTSLEATKKYIQCLEKGGFILKVSDAPFEKAEYQLLKDNGIESPKINSDGELITMGLAQEAMWRCLRIRKEIDAWGIYHQVEATGIVITMDNVRRYLRMLKRAGYLRVVSPAIPHKKKTEILALIGAMNTGPRPPQVQRVGIVYDPNLNKVMYADDPEELL